MGSYNITHIEVRKPGGQWEHCSSFPEGVYLADETPFNYQDYDLYALVANVRNDYHQIIPIAERRGLPKDASQYVLELYKGCKNPEPEDGCYWGWEPYSEPGLDTTRWGSTTHFTIQELLDYPHYDREVTPNASRSVDPGTDLRKLLGENFFNTLEAFKNWSEYTPENIRVIMSFD